MDEKYCKCHVPGNVRGSGIGVQTFYTVAALLLTTIRIGETKQVGFVDHSNWMSKLHEDLKDIPLNQL